MRAPRPLLLALFVLAAAPAAARAHEVELQDGTVLEGRVTGETEDEVVIETTFDGTHHVPRAQVKRVDTSVPPLRDQLQYRADRARDDVPALWKLHHWAEENGFREELPWILQRILELKPGDAKAHRLLGHVKVDGQWMTPEEKEAYLLAKQEEEMRAKGLVPYRGRWVTPEEKDALERGLVRDGDAWVTEEEYHHRRGEELVDGAWVRVGEKEGLAWSEEAGRGARVTLGYLWSPHVDAAFDCNEELAQKILDACEAAVALHRRTLRPQGNEQPEGLEGRLRVALFDKLPAYARFAQWFDEQEKASDLVPGWGRSVQKQHAFWWADPRPTAGVYRFPNTDQTFTSNAVHNLGLLLLTRYRFNFRFQHVWLREGYAYWLEMETLGYSESFTLGRGGTAASADGDRPAWADSARWRDALRGAVQRGEDVPMGRLGVMESDRMGYEELVKSWSVVECLVTWDADRFKAFIDAIKDRDKTEEDALKEAYDVDYRGLDTRWHAWVAAGFRHP